MGRISRDARLLFVLMWTIADDFGRLRGAPRYLASRAFPYDEDAPGLVEGWLAELEREGCVRRYVSGDSQYIEIPNWSRHQLVNKPTPSRLPDPPGAAGADSACQGIAPESPGKPMPRARALDLGPRTMDLGQRTDTRTPSGSCEETRKQPTPQSAQADVWQGLEDAIRASYGGKRTRHATSGERLAWVGNIIRVAGAKARDDPAAAIALWQDWWASLEPRYRPQPNAAADKLATWDAKLATDPVVRF